MLDTSFEVDLIDGQGEATVTNVATSLFDSNSELLERLLHAEPFGDPDTIPVDPVPTYRIVVHTIPPLERDDVRFTPRKHNHVRFGKCRQAPSSRSLPAENAVHAVTCPLRYTDREKPPLSP